MASTSDLFAQALANFQRSGGSPTTKLTDFDPTAYLQTYGKAAAGDFSAELKRSIGDLKGQAVGANRLKTGFYDEDAGRLTTDIADRYQRDLASKATEAAGMKLSATGQAAGMQEEEQNRYLDLLSGQLDRDTAAQNARRQQQGSVWSGLGSLAGTLGGALLLSSKRFKDDISPIEGASDRLERMPGVNFRYKGSEQPQVGVLAEDADQAAPEAVMHDEQDQPLAVDYTKLVPLVIQATREQGEEIRQLRGEIARIASGGRLGERVAA